MIPGAVCSGNRLRTTVVYLKTGKRLNRIPGSHRERARVCVKCRVRDSEPIDDFIVMKNRLLIPLLLAASVVGCRTPHLAASFTGADGEVRLICLDPGHFHAALVQKYPNPRIDSTVWVYAPAGDEVQGYLDLIETFNAREKDPTHWQEKTYIGADYLEKMLAEQRGNVVLLAGNNGRKIDYIERSVGAGLNVFADKPLVIDSAGFARLERVFSEAGGKGVLVYDIMTERYDLLNILQRELMRDSALFGTIVKGTPQQPAVEVTSIHSFYKEVAGKPLTRPAWYYDVTQQGEGIADVTTHLIDLAAWKCFPGEPVDYRNDVEVLSATHYPTPVTRSQYARSTGCAEFPAYLSGAVHDSILDVEANGTILYTLKGVHVAIDVQWKFENPPGSGDIARSVIRGTKATLSILQDTEQGYKPMLYAEPAPGVDAAVFERSLAAAVARLAQQYPGLTAVLEPVSATVSSKEAKTAGKAALRPVRVLAGQPSAARMRIVVPAGSDPGHEAHFASVFRCYTDYLVQGMPQWERDAILAKYYITTKAHAMAQQKR